MKTLIALVLFTLSLMFTPAFAEDVGGECQTEAAFLAQVEESEIPGLEVRRLQGDDWRTFNAGIVLSGAPPAPEGTAYGLLVNPNSEALPPSYSRVALSVYDAKGCFLGGILLPRPMARRALGML